MELTKAESKEITYLIQQCMHLNPTKQLPFFARVIQSKKNLNIAQKQFKKPAITSQQDMKDLMEQVLKHNTIQRAEFRRRVLIEKGFSAAFSEKEIDYLYQIFAFRNETIDPSKDYYTLSPSYKRLQIISFFLSLFELPLDQ